MREDYLHHLFETRRLGNSFQTTKGETLEIREFGQLNPNAGPDFLNAQVLAANTTWAGSIEFHVKSSDWYLHGHQKDKRYNNVIAHFVYEHDREVTVNGRILPTIELRKKIDWDHYRKYTTMVESRSQIPCETAINSVPHLFIYAQKERALLHRLNRKSERLLHDLERYKGDREKVFYLALARVFGGKVNEAAFESLLERLDLVSLRRMVQREMPVDAILFGTAGLLPERADDPYVSALIREFDFQKKRLKITPLAADTFRFSRMHPPGFPTIRLAQFSSLFQTGFPLGALLRGELDPTQVRAAFCLAVPPFWHNHYRFEKASKGHAGNLSSGFVDLLIVNAVVPFLFAVGLLEDDEQQKGRALDYLIGTPAENNTLIRFWKKLGLNAATAFDSQALIEQKNEFCLRKKCLFCIVGNQLLKS